MRMPLKQKQEETLEEQILWTSSENVKTNYCFNLICFC